LNLDSEIEGAQQESPVEILKRAEVAISQITKLPTYPITKSLTTSKP